MILDRETALQFEEDKREDEKEMLERLERLEKIISSLLVQGTDSLQAVSTLQFPSESPQEPSLARGRTLLQASDRQQ